MRAYSRMLISSLSENREKRRRFNFGVREWHHKESEFLRDRFIVLNSDDPEFQAFVNMCYEDYYRIIPTWKQLKHNYGKPLLKLVGYSLTDSLAMLNTGHMFVLSSHQARMLLKMNEDDLLDNMLDIGSGDGEVSRYVTSLCKRAILTESNKPMVDTLISKGFEAIHCSSLQQDSIQSEGPFSLITCFNVLDRCDKPLSLLREMHSLLKPDGLLLLTVVYPFHPFVENGTQQLVPTELLKVDNCCWESSVIFLVNKVFAVTGFELVRFARVPYLSEGDYNSPIYSLDSTAYVLRRREKKKKVDSKIFSLEKEEITPNNTQNKDSMEVEPPDSAPEVCPTAV